MCSFSYQNSYFFLILADVVKLLLRYIVDLHYSKSLNNNVEIREIYFHKKY